MYQRKITHTLLRMFGISKGFHNISNMSIIHLLVYTLGSRKAFNKGGCSTVSAGVTMGAKSFQSRTDGRRESQLYTGRKKLLSYFGRMWEATEVQLVSTTILVGRRINGGDSGCSHERRQ